MPSNNTNDSSTGNAGNSGSTGNSGSSNNSDSTRDEFRTLLREAIAEAGRTGASGLSEREERLLSENFKVRDKARKLEEQLAAAKVPDGHVVVPKADADELVAFRAVGVKPADLKPKLDEHRALVEDKAQRDADKQVAAVAKVMGVNERALQRLVKAEGLTVEIKKVKVRDENGDTVEEDMPVVRRRGAKPEDEPEDLVTVLERDFPDDIPLLTRDHVETRASLSLSSGNGAGGGLRAADVDEIAPQGGLARFPRVSQTESTPLARTRTKEADAVAQKAASGNYRL